MRFSSPRARPGFPKMFRRLPKIPEDFRTLSKMSEEVPMISEHFRSYLKLFQWLSNVFKRDILACFDRVIGLKLDIKRSLMEYFLGELN